MGMFSSKIATEKEIQSDDTVFLILGLAGSGKTTFINKASNGSHLSVGHKLTPAATKGFAMVLCEAQNQRLILVDTPSYEDGEKDIKSWLKKNKHIKVKGAILLHNIISNRAPIRPEDIFISLKGSCGGARFMLVTTMWDDVKNWRKTEDEMKVGMQRLEENQKDYADGWGVKTGGKHLKHDGSTESAWTIVKQMV